MSSGPWLVAIAHPETRTRVASVLDSAGGWLPADSPEAWHFPSAGAIVDLHGLRRHVSWLEHRRSETGKAWPVLCLASRKHIPALRPYWGELIDDVAPVPPKSEEILLRLQRLSQDRERLRLLHAQRLEKAAFMHLAMHDLRAPLRVIKGYAEAIQEDHGGRLPHEAKSYLDRIGRIAREMNQLLERIYLFCRLGEQVRTRSIRILPLLEQVRHAFRDAIADAGAEVRLEGEKAWVRGDTELLRLAVGELLANALTYRSPQRTPRVTLRVTVRSPWVRITVEDNGIGIAEEDRERIFTPLVRLHGQEAYPGAGMGLAIVDKITWLLGARRGVTSTPGEGSQFWIELPESGPEGDAEYDDLAHR